MGALDSHPGRAVPIYTAASDLQHCAKMGAYDPPPLRAVAVFVHDAERATERECSKAFLGDNAANHSFAPARLRAKIRQKYPRVEALKTLLHFEYDVHRKQPREQPQE